MKEFEVGKTYSTRSICDHNCTISLTVTARTAATITTIDDRGEVQRLKIAKKVSTYRNAETVYPWGQYSMAPMIDATQNA